MPRYKPPELTDDIPKLRDSITHAIEPGHDVKVSIGGMSTTVVRCLSKGRDGILVENEAGQRFMVRWNHVVGSAEKPQAAPLAKAIQDDEQPEDDLPFKIDRFGITFTPLNFIKTPVEFDDDDEQSDRWSLALHEAGHAVVAQLVGGCGGCGIEKLSGFWHGVAYDQCDEGSQRYRVAIAGKAAEVLGSDSPRFYYESGDYTHARLEAAIAGFTEKEIPAKIARDVVDVADEFASRWAKSIRAIATALCERGWLSGDQVRTAMGDAQAMLTKSNPVPMRKIEEIWPRRTPKKHPIPVMFVRKST